MQQESARWAGRGQATNTAMLAVQALHKHAWCHMMDVDCMQHVCRDDHIFCHVAEPTPQMLDIERKATNLRRPVLARAAPSSWFLLQQERSRDNDSSSTGESERS
jgi:hypothetical protein